MIGPEDPTLVLTLCWTWDQTSHHGLPCGEEISSLRHLESLSPKTCSPEAVPVQMHACVGVFSCSARLQLMEL